MHIHPTIAACLQPFVCSMDIGTLEAPPAGVDPFEEGRAACFGRNVPFRFITENPYAPGIMAHVHWRDGWMAADLELRGEKHV